MFNNIKKAVNEREYDLFLNTRKIDIKVKRIKSLKDYRESLLYKSELGLNKGYFIYNEQNFSSYGIREEVDVVWVNWDGKIINIEEGFKPNKISKVIEGTKFIYIFNKGIVNRKSIILNGVINHAYNRKGKKNHSIISI